MQELVDVSTHRVGGDTVTSKGWIPVVGAVPSLELGELDGCASTARLPRC